MAALRRWMTIAVTTLLVLGCEGTRDASAPVVVPPGTARTIEFPGARTSVLLEDAATQGGVAFAELRVEPGSFGAPPHVHRDEDEYVYVLEGEVQLLTGERVVPAPAGAFAALTRGHLHAFWNATDEPARLLVAIAPGRFATFFDEVVLELRASGATDAATVGETIVRLGKKWNVDVHPERVPDAARPFLPQ